MPSCSSWPRSPAERDARRAYAADRSPHIGRTVRKEKTPVLCCSARFAMVPDMRSLPRKHLDHPLRVGDAQHLLELDPGSQSETVKRTTGFEPATFGLGSRRSTD